MRVLFLLSLFSCAARADTLVLLSANGNNVAFGYYLSPYYGAIDGQPVTLYCDDFADDVNFNWSWPVNVTQLSSSNLSNTLFGTDARTQYEEAAWLTTQLVPGGGPNNADIQATIWDLFPNNGSPPTPSSNSPWLQQAVQNYGSLNDSDFFIYTDARTNFGDPPSRGQEYIVYESPEPGSIVLLATVCLCMTLLFRRRCSGRFERQS
jgi:hypothetical protein